MLSNTADTKPRPSVDCGEAAGRLSTGIIEAASTSDSRNTAPFAAAGITVKSGRRHGVSNRSDGDDRGADVRKRAAASGRQCIRVDIGGDGGREDRTTMTSRGLST